MKKLSLFLVLLMLASTMVFASGSRAQADGRTEISLQFGNWWEHKAPGLVEEFERTFPQYRLNVILLPIAGYFDNAAVAILGGTAPDILDIDVTQVSSFASRSLFRDITTLFQGRVNPADFITSAWESSHFNGRMYGFPNRGTGGVMYYNMNIFDRFNEPYPRDDWTPEEFLAIAQRLTIPGEVYGASIAADPSDPMNVFTTFSPFLWAFGADYLSPDNRTVTLNTPAAVRALTFWSELYTRHRVVPEGSVSFTSTRDIAPLFEQDRVAMMIHGLGGIQQFGNNPNVRFGMVQVPGGFSRAGGWTFAVPVSTPENKIPAVVDFLLWYAQPEIQSRHSEIEPSNIAAWAIAPPWNSEMYQAFVVAANNGKTLPAIGGWGEAQRIIITELQNILLGNKTPQQAGDDMVRLITPHL